MTSSSVANFVVPSSKAALPLIFLSDLHTHRSCPVRATMSTKSSSSAAAAFRAKVEAMKAWRPASAVSNRDRLELFALHKQAVAGDAPSQGKGGGGGRGGDRQKAKAWRAKRGMGQAEAMSAYVAECDRQVRVYGTASDQAASAPPAASAGAGAGAAGGAADSAAQTPRGSPATGGGADGGGGRGAPHPRGIAAVPLLCAAAAEPREAYLRRLRQTGSPSNGWWRKQEPLCADPGTPLASPEAIVLAGATWVEGVSLNLSTAWAASLPLPPSVLQSFLWPLHNVLLSVWIVLIFLCTYAGSALLLGRTVLLGARSTGAPLSRIFAEEIGPAQRAAAALCEPHQAVPMRLTGLALMPYGTLCGTARSVADRAGDVAGACAYVGLAVFFWWYFLCVLPWLAFAEVAAAVGTGWCFALIEMAGM